MTIYAIVPVHNRIELTLQFLDSLEEQEIDEEVRVIIVDDGSTDGTAQALQKRESRFPITVLPGSGKLWWAGAVRKALTFLKPHLADGDWVYLGNNDTILDRHHLRYLLETARTHSPALVGAVSVEVWPDGSEHAVSSGFRVDQECLTITIIDHSNDGDVDALAGRGLLMPAETALHFSLHPRLMPQHFADLSATARLKSQGFALVVEPRALSTQTDRAGSALEWGAIQGLSLKRKSPMYLPALTAFWWIYFGPRRFLGIVPRAFCRLRSRHRSST